MAADKTSILHRVGILNLDVATEDYLSICREELDKLLMA